jgi:hypothetical protein
MTTSLQHLWRWIDFRQARAEFACDAVDGAQKPASGHARKERVLLIGIDQRITIALLRRPPVIARSALREAGRNCDHDRKARTSYRPMAQ